MEPEVSLRSLKKRITGVCHEPDEPTPHPRTLETALEYRRVLTGSTRNTEASLIVCTFPHYIQYTRVINYDGVVSRIFDLCIRLRCVVTFKPFCLAPERPLVPIVFL